MHVHEVCAPTQFYVLSSGFFRCVCVMAVEQSSVTFLLWESHCTAEHKYATPLHRPHFFSLKQSHFSKAWSVALKKIISEHLGEFPYLLANIQRLRTEGSVTPYAIDSWHCSLEVRCSEHYGDFCLKTPGDPVVTSTRPNEHRVI